MHSIQIPQKKIKSVKREKITQEVKSNVLEEQSSKIQAT